MLLVTGEVSGVVQEAPVLDDLRALVEFAQAGSIAGAADRLYRTPSAITRQLQRLEAALGAELLDRSVKPPRLNLTGYSPVNWFDLRLSVAIVRVGQLGVLERDERGLRHLDFAACDVGRGATDADRGHNAVALTRLCFDFASAPPSRHLAGSKDGRPSRQSRALMPSPRLGLHKRRPSRHLLQRPALRERGPLRVSVA